MISRGFRSPPRGSAGEAPGKGKAKGKGGKGQKKVGEGQFVRVRLFGVHGSEDIKAEVLQLLDMLLHPNEQLRTIRFKYYE